MLQSPTPQEKQQVLRLVVDHILVGKEQLIIKHVVPLAGDRRLHTQRSDVIVVEPGEVHTFAESTPDYFHFVLHCPPIKGDKVVIE